MKPDEFRKQLNELIRLARNEQVSLAQIVDRARFLKDAYRAAWENRVPDETLSLSVTELGTVVRIVEHHAGLWAATAQQPPFASAFGATPALALEAWRKENEK